MHHATKIPEGVGLYGFFIAGLCIRVDTTTPRQLSTQDSWHSQEDVSLSQFGRRFKKKNSLPHQCS